MKYLGVDIGGTSVKLGVVDDEGKIICKKNYSVSFDFYETPIIETVKKSIPKFLKDNFLDLKEIEKIGVSATGQINTSTGEVVGVGGNIKNWLGTNIKKELEMEFKKEVSVINDANSMVIGEMYKGAGVLYKNIIGITIGTGVGGGIIVDSKILNGSIGIGGEIGHFSIDRNGVECTCGNKGCLERYASTKALIKKVKEAFEEEDFTGEDIFDEINKDNRKMKTIVDEWIEDLAKGLTSLVHIFNPEIIIVGGAISVQEENFINPLRKKILEKVMPKFSENLRIERAILENDAGLIGAIYNLNR